VVIIRYKVGVLVAMGSTGYMTADLSESESMGSSVYYVTLMRCLFSDTRNCYFIRCGMFVRLYGWMGCQGVVWIGQIAS
jgi:hypothetical protein